MKETMKFTENTTAKIIGAKENMQSPYEINWRRKWRGNLMKKIAHSINVKTAKGGYSIRESRYYTTYEAKPHLGIGAYWFTFDDCVPRQVDPGKEIGTPNVIVTPDSITILY